MIKIVYRVSNFSPRTRLEKLPSIEDGGQTDGVTNLANNDPMTLTYDLVFQSQASYMIMTDPHAKNRGQLVQNLTVETNKRTFTKAEICNL